tara:strand:+ start:5477 stop:6013 length:537 start_codon:yes stop_codon:yes gene_type:complete
MFHIDLSFLSPEKQKHMHKMVYAQFFQYVLKIILLFALISSIILLTTEQKLLLYKYSAESNLHIAPNQITKMNNNIAEINNTLFTTQVVQKAFTPWTTYLTDLFGNIPEGIYLSFAELSIKDKKCIFAGEGKTREDILAFQRKMEQLPWVLHVAVPITQLTKKVDVPFSMEITLREDI